MEPCRLPNCDNNFEEIQQFNDFIKHIKLFFDVKYNEDSVSSNNKWSFFIQP